MQSSDEFFNDYKSMGSSKTTISTKQFEDYEVVVMGSAKVNTTHLSTLHNGFVLNKETRIPSIEVFLIL